MARGPHIPVGLLVGVAVVAAAVGGLLGVAVAKQLGWPEAATAMAPSMLGSGVVLAVGVFAAVLMQLLAAGDHRRVGNALLAGTTVRLLGTMFGGLVVSLLITQDRPMWLGLLCAGMLALMLDTMVLLKAAGANDLPGTGTGTGDGISAATQNSIVQGKEISPQHKNARGGAIAQLAMTTAEHPTA